MTARKKSGRGRKNPTRRKSSRKKSGGAGTASKARSGSRKSGTRKARKTPRTRKSARKKTGGKAEATRRAKRTGGARARRSRRAAPRAASLADRLTELVEHAAASAVRRVVDTGGRRITAWMPEASEMRREAGAYLRELRELAGLTRDELADAAELRDHSIIDAVEAGTATASFELILRLAAILSRHDPVPFISRMLRSYNPVLWALLEDWGIGRLPLQLEREREFVNVLRGHDAARELDDEGFAQVLAFTRSAFELALHFATQDDPSAGTPDDDRE